MKVGTLVGIVKDGNLTFEVKDVKEVKSLQNLRKFRKSEIVLKKELKQIRKAREFDKASLAREFSI